MMEIVNGPKTTNNSKSTDEHKKKQFHIRLSPSLHQTRVCATVVPVSFMTLPILIDELWKTFTKIGGEEFKKHNDLKNRDIFKKIMLTLAEAKVCCAQLAFPLDLPQRDLYFYQELLDLNLLAKKLPYPLALYLDCLGNTVEGELNIIPVLAELESVTDVGAISGGPRQIAPLLKLLRGGVDCESDVHNLAKELQALPNFYWKDRHCDGKKHIFSTDSSVFWLTSDGSINISNDEIDIFQKIIDCFDDTNFNTETELLKGQGTMAQAVQTPEWQLNRRFHYFCMTDVNEYDQKLGATFGFSFTNGRKIQSSRYGGSFKTAYSQGEVLPQKMLKAMLEENLV